MSGQSRAIKTRIKSVQSTRQITKAMELVATSKLKAAKDSAERTKPFFTTLKNAMDDIARNNIDFESPFCRLDATKPACHIIIAGDRGLAGGYNHNLFKSVKVNDNDLILPIGKKAYEHFSKTNAEIISDVYTTAADINIPSCYNMGTVLADLYTKGRYGTLYIEYTKFINVLVQEPAHDKILPIIYDKTSERGGKSMIIYEPSATEAFDYIIPQYISGVIYGALKSSLASEISARRNAMQSATKNADEMLNNLSLEYNRARQTAITQELTEIVAGASEQ